MVVRFRDSFAGSRRWGWRPPAAAEVLEERVLMTLGAPEDLIGYYQGQWYASTSNWSVGNLLFPEATTRLWAGWSNADWDALTQGDFNGDGRTDVLGQVDGGWYVGLSDGVRFNTSRFAQWSAATNWEDTLVGDLNHDGRDDVVARAGGTGAWYAALSNGTSFGTPTAWTVTGLSQWDRVFLADASGDGRDDLVLYNNGLWYVATANLAGTGFNAATLWAQWSDAPFQLLTLGEMNGDGKLDAVGFINGQWWVGVSKGNRFDTLQRPVASFRPDVTWEDPILADINGDNRFDLLARTRGYWYLALNTTIVADPLLPNFVKVPVPWEKWADVDWEDIRVGDFNGDGLDDVAGRHLGAWYVAVEGSLLSHKFARWVDVDWRAVAAGQVGGATFPLLPIRLAGDPVVGSPLGGAGLSTPAAATPASGADDDPVYLFWASSAEDEDLVSGLLAASA